MLVIRNQQITQLTGALNRPAVMPCDGLPDFIVHLHINPEDPQARDDHYRLLNEDGSVHQDRTVCNDAEPGDGILTLRFTDLLPGRKYSLEIDLGAEGRYFAFYGVTLEDLVETANDTMATVQSEAESTVPDSFQEAPNDGELTMPPLEALAPPADPSWQSGEQFASISDRAGQWIL
jgi:hypothetical protein